jgi:hypothetical protein
VIISGGHMCCKAMIGLVLGLAGVAAAQEPGGFPDERMVTVTGGVGNAMGWFGVQGERYFLDERIRSSPGWGILREWSGASPTGPPSPPGCARLLPG